jgi:hypothetical protein
MTNDILARLTIRRLVYIIAPQLNSATLIQRGGGTGPTKPRQPECYACMATMTFAAITHQTVPNPAVYLDDESDARANC